MVTCEATTARERLNEDFALHLSFSSQYNDAVDVAARLLLVFCLAALEELDDGRSFGCFFCLLFQLFDV